MSPKPKKAGADRERLISISVLVLCLVSLAVHVGIRAAMVLSLKHQLKKDAPAELQAREQEVREDEAQFQAALADAAGAVQEGRAAKVRAEEFRRRQGMEESFAQSLEEKRLLEMARLSRESSLGKVGVLEELAKLASPRSSGIRVRREGKWSSMELAVPLSEVPVDTRGGRQDTEDLHRAVRWTVAGIIRDLFAFGAAQDLQSVEVAVLKRVDVSRDSAVPETRQEYLEFYRAGLASRSSNPEVWLSIGRPDVLRMMSVQHDEFGRIMPRR
jgi:hypothetical protein